MYTKQYWKELFSKQTIFEWILISVFLFGMVFFSIFDINGGVVLSPNWTNSGKFSAYSIIGQLLILIASFVSTLVVMNRMHRMKQEIPFLLLGALLTGLGLLMTGYAGFELKQTAAMAPGVIQMFVFGMSALSGLAKYKDHTEDVIPAKKKFFSVELVIALSVVVISIFPFYMIFDKLGARSFTAGETIDWIEWLGIIAFAFSSAAIVVMVLFRWTWTFIFWTIANVIFVAYYILLKTEHGVPVLSLMAISALFTAIDFYILIRWIKDQKTPIEKTKEIK